jgi:hypothetical protein
MPSSTGSAGTFAGGGAGGEGEGEGGGGGGAAARDSLFGSIAAASSFSMAATRAASRVYAKTTGSQAMGVAMNAIARRPHNRRCRTRAMAARRSQHQHPVTPGHSSRNLDDAGSR